MCLCCHSCAAQKQISRSRCFVSPAVESELWRGKGPDGDQAMCQHLRCRQLGKGEPPLPFLGKREIESLFPYSSYKWCCPFQGCLYLNEAGNFCHAVLTSQLFHLLLFPICLYKGIKIHSFTSNLYGILILEVIRT